MNYKKVLRKVLSYVFVVGMMSSLIGCGTDKAVSIESGANETKQEAEETVETDAVAGILDEKESESVDLVEAAAVNETVYATTGVNVRVGAGIKYERIGLLHYGQSVQRIDSVDGWSKVLYDDKEAYICSEYLTTEVPVSDISNYPMTYSDETASITITKEWYENAWCYIAHLQFTDYSRFGTACANGSYGGGYETAADAAERLNAVFAVNGCNSVPYLNYTVVRSGKIWNGAGKDMMLPAVYSSSTGLFQSAWCTGGTSGIVGVNVGTLVENGLVTDTFCFGPPILSGGSVVTNSDTDRAQRTFIGSNGKAGDIWIVVSEGRMKDGESSGLTYTQCASLLKAKGCTFGVCLDGGGSSTMVFEGKVLNSAKANQRKLVDFVYFK